MEYHRKPQRFLSAGVMSRTVQAVLLTKGRPSQRTHLRSSLSLVTKNHELMIGWETDNAGIEVLVCFHVYFIDLFAF